MLTIGTITVDLVTLSSILGWMFVGGMVAMFAGCALAFLGAMLTKSQNWIGVSAGALFVLVFGIIAGVSKYVTWFGGIGWVVLWIYTSVVSGGL